MTDHTAALRDLLAKVEAGECTVHCAKMAIPKFYELAFTAYQGSLDAALSLHEMVLPGRTYMLASSPCRAMVYTFRGAAFDGTADRPARAWLIAILRALISTETPQPPRQTPTSPPD